jgi:hypothetical protein
MIKTPDIGSAYASGTRGKDKGDRGNSKFYMGKRFKYNDSNQQVEFGSPDQNEEKERQLALRRKLYEEELNKQMEEFRAQQIVA